ncbi:MAG TPA: hypothetical protein DCP02_03135 [Actinobacteria bacterium]|nr:hypothetical protein [Actinomycetota bacterium]
MELKYDIIISGAGPSGSLLGYLLSLEGINTLIIEKKDFPRYKICAGGLQHRALALIPFDVGKVLQKSFNGILFTYRRRDSFSRKHESPVLYTVDRREFDFYLAKVAQKKGCTIRFGEEVTGFEYDKTGLTVRTDKNKFRSKILVGADGIRGAIHRKLTAGRKILKILGYEVEKRCGSSEMEKYRDLVGLDFGGIRKGYVWAFPKNDMISYGIGGPVSAAGAMRKYFNEYLGNNGSGDNNMMAQCIPIKSEDTPAHTDRVILIGDAACLGDGFTGEGLYNAFKSSHLALRSIKDALKSSNYSFNDYAGAVDSDIYKDIKISIAFSRIFYAYPMFFYKLLKSNERFFRLCCQVLRGDKKYSDISGRLNLFNK